MITLSQLTVGQAPTKAATVRRLLARPQGATLDDIAAETGWQPHSIRAFLTGLRKRGLAVERTARVNGMTCYRLRPGAAQ